MTRSTVLLSMAVALSLALGVARANAQTKGDGIKVHGHWTVDIRNPDGTLASHNEFENACVDCGQALGAVLTRQASVTEWRVLASGSQLPCDFAGFPTPCTLVEPSVLIIGPFANSLFPSLQLSAAGTTFDLAGSFTAPHAGQLDNFDSQLFLSGTGAVLFSRRSLSAPISVAAGQTVYLKVTFSFS